MLRPLLRPDCPKSKSKLPADVAAKVGTWSLAHVHKVWGAAVPQTEAGGLGGGRPADFMYMRNIPCPYLGIDTGSCNEIVDFRLCLGQDGTTKAPGYGRIRVGLIST